MNGAVVKKYELGTKLASETLFSIPFVEVAMAWGSSVAGPHYFYPKPAAYLESPLYVWENGEVAREPVSGYGLEALHGKGVIIYSTRNQDQVASIFAPGLTPFKTNLKTNISKCGFNKFGTEIACAVPNNYSQSTHEEWLQGTSNTSGPSYNN